MDRPHPERSLHYSPALDGLRGLAILLVMLYHQCIFEPLAGIDHAYYAAAKSGWVGVDLFFVLSGFLITGVLLDAKGDKRYFRNFFARRALRILPLYYAVLLGFCVVLPLMTGAPGHLGALARDYQDTAQHQAWFWLHGANIFFALFGWLSHGIPNVFWSLAIEEQFYLFWPFVARWCGARRLAIVSAAIVVGSLLFRLAMLHTPAWGWVDEHLVSNTYQARETFVFNATPGRLDAIGLGALLACLARTHGLQQFRPAALLVFPGSLALLVALAWGEVRLDEYVPRVQGFGFTLVALTGASLLVIATTARPGSLLLRILSSSPARTLGKYSFALYLFHFPIQSVLRTLKITPGRVPLLLGSALPGQLAFSVVVIAISLVAAWLSWHLLEKRFLSLKSRFAPRHAPGPASSHAPSPVTSPVTSPAP